MVMKCDKKALWLFEKWFYLSCMKNVTELNTENSIFNFLSLITFNLKLLSFYFSEFQRRK